MNTNTHVQIFDRLLREKIPFGPKIEGDVGHDLEAVISINDMSLFDRIIARLIRSTEPLFIIWPFSIRNVSSGLHLVMRMNTWCEIKSRSSTAKRMLTVIGGNIDSGYKGELFTILHNVGFKPRIIRNGERYSQVIFHRAIRPEIHPMKYHEFIEAYEKGRGGDGFGSTGK